MAIRLLLTALGALLGLLVWRGVLNQANPLILVGPAERQRYGRSASDHLSQRTTTV